MKLKDKIIVGKITNLIMKTSFGERLQKFVDIWALMNREAGHRNCLEYCQKFLKQLEFKDSKEKKETIKRIQKEIKESKERQKELNNQLNKF